MCVYACSVFLVWNIKTWLQSNTWNLKCRYSIHTFRNLFTYIKRHSIHRYAKHCGHFISWNLYWHLKLEHFIKLMTSKHISWQRNAQRAATLSKYTEKNLAKVHFQHWLTISAYWMAKTCVKIPQNREHSKLKSMLTLYLSNGHRHYVLVTYRVRFK